MNTIEINGVSYTKTDSIKEMSLAKKVDSLRYVVCRTYSAGVHIGYLKKKDGQSVELHNSRRLYSWAGAMSLSQVAMDGVDSDSKFAMVLPEITIEQVIEIIPVSEKAKLILEGLPEWKK